MRRPRVVDFSTHVSGPLAANLLGQLGADVIKVENPSTGDTNRYVPPFVGGMGLLHWALNTGARSLAISRHSPRWSEVIASCAKWADVAIVGMRPKDAHTLGIDFLSLTKHNPDLLYCSITGYGEHGPWAEYVGHGINFDARAGMLPVEVTATAANMRPEYVVPVGTTLAGVLGALGVFAGLYQREHGNGAQYVDVSIWHAAMWWNMRNLIAIANLGHPLPPYSEFGSRYSLYRTLDGRAILVAPIERKFWEEFCEVIGLPESAKSQGDWATGMDWGKGNQTEQRAIAELVSKRTLEDWTARLARTQVPFAPVLTAQEALASDHARAEHVLGRVESGELVPRLAVNISKGPDAELDEGAPRPPGLGEHSAEILQEIGLAHLRTELDEGRLLA